MAHHCTNRPQRAHHQHLYSVMEYNVYKVQYVKPLHFLINMTWTYYFLESKVVIFIIVTFSILMRCIINCSDLLSWDLSSMFYAWVFLTLSFSSWRHGGMVEQWVVHMPHSKKFVGSIPVLVRASLGIQGFSLGTPTPPHRPKTCSLGWLVTRFVTCFWLMINSSLLQPQKG